MFKKSDYLAAWLLATGIVLAAPIARADHSANDQCSANEIIGKKVKNYLDQDLGRVQDLIVNWEAGTIPFAVIAHGGVLGAGRSMTAVPLDLLQTSADGKILTIAATKEQLQAANRAGEAWAAVAKAEWAKNIDGFYGNPASSRFASSRPKHSADIKERTYGRDPAAKGAEHLMARKDAELCQKICESTDVVHVRVENGVTHLHGQVENVEAKKTLESKVRAVPGVDKVESHLRVKNP